MKKVPHWQCSWPGSLTTGIIIKDKGHVKASIPLKSAVISQKEVVLLRKWKSLKHGIHRKGQALNPVGFQEGF